MALLGGQLVLTLIVACVMQKLSPYFSFGRWILCSTRLYRYVQPKDEELKSLIGVPKGRSHNRTEKSTFYVPKNLDFQLRTSKISYADVIYLRYYDEYKWLVDFSIYTIFVYTLSELLQYFFPRREELNLSLIWCTVVVLYAIKYLSSITRLYFKNDTSIGERSMCIVAFLVYLLISMVVLILDESILESGLEEAYSSFSIRAKEFLAEHGLPSSGVTSKIVAKFCIASFCGFLGCLFTFPGLRMARMHWDSLKYYKYDKLMQLALNLNLILPLLLVTLWIRPISRYLLTERPFRGTNKPLLTSDGFETARLIAVVFVILLRLSLLPVYLQSYLNVAKNRMKELKNEAGRITNVELQQKISSIFNYLCVVILQFIAPLIICLYLTFIYKNLAELSWFATTNHKNSTISNTQQNVLNNKFSDDSFSKTVADIQITFHSLKEVFNAKVFRGVLGFMLWWNCFTLFLSSSFGLLYQTYFTKV